MELRGADALGPGVRPASRKARRRATAGYHGESNSLDYCICIYPLEDRLVIN
jgi:hypothetical protein